MAPGHDRQVLREDLLFDIEMALRGASGLLPKRSAAGDHDRLKPVAIAIMDYLGRCRIRCCRLPPAGASCAADFCPELRRDAATDSGASDQEPRG